jgi:hypothetical protein
MEIWEDEIRAKWFDHGFEAGLQAARDEYGLSLNDRY